MNWKEELIKEMPFLSDQSLGTIESLLKKQRKEVYDIGYKVGNHFKSQEKYELKKDLINQILSEAPALRDGKTYLKDYADGYNKANQLWRSLLTKHLI